MTQLALMATFLLGALAPAMALRSSESESTQEERNEAEEEVEATHAIARRRSGHRTTFGASVVGALGIERAPRSIEPTKAPPDVRPQTALPRRTAPPGDEADVG
jgi:hypothetical protein